jgi:hypothetical protein
MHFRAVEHGPTKLTRPRLLPNDLFALPSSNVIRSMVPEIMNLEKPRLFRNFFDESRVQQCVGEPLRFSIPPGEALHIQCLAKEFVPILIARIPQRLESPTRQDVASE